MNKEQQIDKEKELAYHVARTLYEKMCKYVGPNHKEHYIDKVLLPFLLKKRSREEEEVTLSTEERE